MDIGQNHRGVYVRVTEQTRYFRSAITSMYSYTVIHYFSQPILFASYNILLIVPERYWGEFSKFFADAEEHMKNVAAGDAPSDVGETSEGEGGQEGVGQRRRAGEEYEYDEEATEKKDWKPWKDYRSVMTGIGLWVCKFSFVLDISAM